MNKQLPKIDNSNLWDKTYSLLKERIVRREFRPDQKLSIPELSEQLGVSRTPVRDALNRLEMDGLVRTVSKVGTFVVGIDARTMEDIMDTRLMLELWVIEKLETVSEEERLDAIRRMEHISRLSADTISNTDIEQYLQEDHNLQFHLTFIKLGNNNKNLELYKQLMQYRFLASKSLITKEMVLSAQNQHLQIIESLKHGDKSDLREVIASHLSDSKDRLLRNMQASGGIL